MNTTAKTFFLTLLMSGIIVVLSFLVTKGVLYFYQHFPSQQAKAITAHELFFGFVLWNGPTLIKTWVTTTSISGETTKVLGVTNVVLVISGAMLVTMNMGLGSSLSQSFIFVGMCFIKLHQLRVRRS